MGETLKLSGRRFELPGAGVQSSGAWNFTQRPGGWLIAERKHPSGKVERYKLMACSSRKSFGVSCNGRLWNGEILVEEKRGGVNAGGGDSDLVAQFPGKVRKILVQEGKKVSEGDGLLLVEAMKMEFTVKAPFNGKVLKVLVKEGQQLSPGDRFLDLDRENGDA